jgi:hypothetical protein
LLLNLAIVLRSYVESAELSRTTLHVIEAFLIILMWFKSLYFLALFESLAPLIDSVYTVINDIKSFLIVFLIAICGYSNAFYIIGKNQVDINTDPEKHPEYAIITRAFMHVYMATLGDFNQDWYYQDEMKPVLMLLFITLSFFMCIHLLNMLIAIMGESFAANNEVKEGKKRLSQLEFVVDNWWLPAFNDKDKIGTIYILGGFLIEQDVGDDGVTEL